MTLRYLPSTEIVTVQDMGLEQINHSEGCFEEHGHSLDQEEIPDRISDVLADAVEFLWENAKN